MVTSDERTTTQKAAEELRQVARYVDRHAESLVGDMDGIYVLEGGLRVSFTLLEHASIPTITVSRECLVYERRDTR